MDVFNPRRRRPLTNRGRQLTEKVLRERRRASIANPLRLLVSGDVGPTVNINNIGMGLVAGVNRPDLKRQSPSAARHPGGHGPVGNRREHFDKPRFLIDPPLVQNETGHQSSWVNNSYPAGTAVGAGTALYLHGRRLRIDNPKIKLEWHSTNSPITKRGGVSKPLENRLKELGIDYKFHETANLPDAETTFSPGANARNGQRAQNYVADYFRNNPGANSRQGAAPGAVNIRKEVPEVTPQGGRRWDIVAEARRPTHPQLSRNTIVEVKSGTTNLSKTVKEQLQKDVFLRGKNERNRGLGTNFRNVGRGLGLLGLAADANAQYDAYKADGNAFGRNSQVQLARTGGGWAGALGGAKVGALACAPLSPLGSLICGGIGAIGGGILGGEIFGNLTDYYLDSTLNSADYKPAPDPDLWTGSA